MRSSKAANHRAPEAICLTCGLCCDGTIFSDVRLLPGDDPVFLASLGLPIKRMRAANPEAPANLPRVHRFTQPCSALNGCRCSIYESRPGHCRQFECVLLKQMQQNRTTRVEALRLIRLARRRAEKVRKLMRALGDTEEQVALPDRFRQTTRQCQQESRDPKTAGLYSQLTLAFHDLILLIRTSFYDPSSPPGK